MFIGSHYDGSIHNQSQRYTQTPRHKEALICDIHSEWGGGNSWLAHACQYKLSIRPLPDAVTQGQTHYIPDSKVCDKAMSLFVSEQLQDTYVGASNYENITIL